MNRLFILQILIIFFFLSSNSIASNQDIFEDAKIYFEKKDYDQSKFLFQKFLVFNPKDHLSYLYLAKIYKKEDNKNETEKNLKEHGDKVPEEDKSKINADIEELKKVKDGDDIEAIKSKTETLVQSSLKLGEAIYKQNPQGGPPQPDPSGEEPSSDKKDEKVVDAEFEEVDENKKD